MYYIKLYTYPCQEPFAPENLPAISMPGLLTNFLSPFATRCVPAHLCLIGSWSWEIHGNSTFEQSTWPCWPISCGGDPLGIHRLLALLTAGSSGIEPLEPLAQSTWDFFPGKNGPMFWVTGRWTRYRFGTPVNDKRNIPKHKSPCWCQPTERWVRL